LSSPFPERKLITHYKSNTYPTPNLADYFAQFFTIEVREEFIHSEKRKIITLTRSILYEEAKHFQYFAALISEKQIFSKT
jgi:hypothetical protein